MGDRLRAALLDQLRGEVPARVLRAVAEVDRGQFVPEELRDRAWEDRSLPIGEGQTISQPSLVARMAALVDPQPDDLVLDVGTGSGYNAAVLVRLARRVISVEPHAVLSGHAAANLAAAGVTGVQLVVADGGAGYLPGAPYDVISVAAAVSGTIPKPLIEQLADGGRLLLPVADEDEQILLLIRRDGGRLTPSTHGRVRFVPFVTPSS